jgi:hypothetical protein
MAAMTSQPSDMITPRISISDAFDSGNIEVVSSEMDDQSAMVRLRIKPDVFTELEKRQHFQYFCFRSTICGQVAGEFNVTYVIENAGQAAFPYAWKGTTVFATSQSYTDADSWTRIRTTRYDEATGHLIWTVPYRPHLYFSYFPPYTYERHLQLIADCYRIASLGTCDVHVQSLGFTLDGRELECIVAGTGSTKAWIIHRQHPGEHMAEFYAEGLLHRLLGIPSQGVVEGLAADLLNMYTFYIVPNMNPDGGRFYRSR